MGSHVGVGFATKGCASSTRMPLKVVSVKPSPYCLRLINIAIVVSWNVTYVRNPRTVVVPCHLPLTLCSCLSPEPRPLGRRRSPVLHIPSLRRQGWGRVLARLRRRQ